MAVASALGSKKAKASPGASVARSSKDTIAKSSSSLRTHERKPTEPMLRAIIKISPPRRGLWHSLIERRIDLVSPPSRRLKNPFTGAMVDFHEPPGVVRIVRSGVGLGAIEPSPEFEEDGELLIWSRGHVPTGLREVVEEICRELAGSLEWCEEEEDDDEYVVPD